MYRLYVSIITVDRAISVLAAGLLFFLQAPKPRPAKAIENCHNYTLVSLTTKASRFWDHHSFYMICISIFN